MEKAELYIPPCCIDKQLPSLVRTGADFCCFYSQGDWGLSKLVHALSSMVSSRQAEVATILVLQDINRNVIKHIEKDLKMNWSSVFIIVTSTDRTVVINDVLSDDLLDRVYYCPSRPEAGYCNMWIRSSSCEHLIITGPIGIGDENIGRVCSYTSSYYQRDKKASQSEQDRLDAIWKARLSQAFAPWRSLCRIHASIRGTHHLFKDWF